MRLYFIHNFKLQKFVFQKKKKKTTKICNLNNLLMTQLLILIF